MKYYIADPHFGHQNIIKMANRPFQSLDEMHAILIANWNKMVQENDEVYIVGDLFYKMDYPEEILSQLNGKKTLILGNHDARWITEEIKTTFFVQVVSSLEINDQNQAVFLCHYPMLSYPKQSRAIMIHGHIHNDTLFDYWHVLVKRPRILNAGVDINNFKPVTLKELSLNNQHYKQQVLDSYPHTLISVRVHTDLLNKEEILHRVTEECEKHNIHYQKEGIYQFKDAKTKELLLHELPLFYKKDFFVQTFKNFDLIEIDEVGNYHYLLCLNENHIAKK